MDIIVPPSSMSRPGSDTSAGVEAHQPPPLSQQQRQVEDERVGALVAAGLEQRLAVHLQDVAHVVFACKREWCISSVLRSTSFVARHELLGALVERLPSSRTTHVHDSDDSAAAPRPALCTVIADALLEAADKGHAKCLRLLLDACSPLESASVDALLNTRDYRGLTPFLSAAQQGRAECVQLLLEHSPAQLTAVNPDRCNALQLAAASGSAACVRLLLAQDPDTQVAAVDAFGSNALMHAADGNDTECVQLLLAYQPDTQVAAITTRGSNALMFAVNKGNTASVQLLLAHRPDIQLAAQAVTGLTALGAAARDAHVGCLQLLLAHSPSKQQRDDAIHKVCQRLAAPNARSRPRSQQERAPAVMCAELLLAHGARLPSQATEDEKEILGLIIQDLAARALVPGMANAAVVGLAFAAVSHRGRPASVEDAAKPSKCAGPSS